MLMPTIPRDAFLSLIGMRSTTWDQRCHVGETSLAFGLSKPPHTNEFVYLDAAAMILCSMINCFVRFELKRAAEIVKERWDGDDGWLALATKAERYPLPDHSEQFVCVAWRSVDRSAPPGVLMGTMDDIATATIGQALAPCFVSMHLLLRCLRGNARTAGIRLPPRLTIDKDEPGYRDWRREIDLYREAAGARLKAKAKPARKRLHPA